MDFKDIAPEIEAIAKRYDYKKPPDFLIVMQENLEKLQRLILDLLASLRIHVPGMADTRAVGNVLQVILILVGGIALGAIIFLLWRRMGQLQAQTKLAKTGHASSTVILNAESWSKEATRLAEQKNYREACRAAYMSALCALSESSVIEFAPTRTNYEYGYALSPKSKDLASTFKKLADITEIIWFGDKTADKADFDQTLSLKSLIEAECQTLKNKADKVVAK